MYSAQGPLPRGFQLSYETKRGSATPEVYPIAATWTRSQVAITS